VCPVHTGTAPDDHFLISCQHVETFWIDCQTSYSRDLSKKHIPRTNGTSSYELPRWHMVKHDWTKYLTRLICIMSETRRCGYSMDSNCPSRFLPWWQQTGSGFPELFPIWYRRVYFDELRLSKVGSVESGRWTVCGDRLSGRPFLICCRHGGKRLESIRHMSNSPNSFKNHVLHTVNYSETGPQTKNHYDGKR